MARPKIYKCGSAMACSFSLPPDLAAIIRETAKAQGISRSKVAVDVFAAHFGAEITYAQKPSNSLPLRELMKSP